MQLQQRITGWSNCSNHLRHLQDRPILFEVVAGIQSCKGHIRLWLFYSCRCCAGMRNKRANNQRVEFNCTHLARAMALVTANPRKTQPLNMSDAPYGVLWVYPCSPCIRLIRTLTFGRIAASTVGGIYSVITALCTLQAHPCQKVSKSVHMRP